MAHSDLIGGNQEQQTSASIVDPRSRIRPSRLAESVVQRHKDAPVALVAGQATRIFRRIDRGVRPRLPLLNAIQRRWSSVAKLAWHGDVTLPLVQQAPLAERAENFGPTPHSPRPPRGSDILQRSIPPQDDVLLAPALAERPAGRHPMWTASFPLSDQALVASNPTVRMASTTNRSRSASLAGPDPRPVRMTKEPLPALRRAVNPGGPRVSREQPMTRPVARTELPGRTLLQQRSAPVATALGRDKPGATTGLERHGDLARPAAPVVAMKRAYPSDHIRRRHDLAARAGQGETFAPSLLRRAPPSNQVVSTAIQVDTAAMTVRRRTAEDEVRRQTGRAQAKMPLAASQATVRRSRDEGEPSSGLGEETSVAVEGEGEPVAEHDVQADTELDTDELAEQVLHRFLRLLAVEGERRGWQPWP